MRSSIFCSPLYCHVICLICIFTRVCIGREIEPKIAEKLLLNFNKYCLPELQWWSYRVLCGFLTDLLRFHRVVVPPFALSFNILPRWVLEAKTRPDRLTEICRKIPPGGSNPLQISRRIRTAVLQSMSLFIRDPSFR